VSLLSWYSHLDEIKDDIDTLIAASRFPQCTVEVLPAPPEGKDVLRVSRKMLAQLFLSVSGVDDRNAATSPDADMRCVAHIYCRDGHTAQQGEKIERNRLAAAFCEQLHVVLRDPGQYQIDAPTGRTWQIGRGDNLRFRNLSYLASMDGRSPDENGLAHWAATWDAALMSEPMNPVTLEDLTRIDVELSGTELGGDNPDDGDNENTRVEYS